MEQNGAKYQDKGWLLEHSKRQKQREIAKECGVSRQTIAHWEKKFGITRREKLSEDFLRRRYIAEKKSTTAIGRELGLTDTTIRRWLLEYGIPVRSKGEGHHLASGHFLVPDGRLLEIIDGELLGDGTVRVQSPFSGQYTHGSASKEDLEYLKALFNRHGVKCSEVYKVIQKVAGHEYPGYRFATRDYDFLLAIRHRWYPDGKKIVPRDIVLTPTVVFHWYKGDGCLGSSKGQRSFITLATCGFKKNDVEFLISLLADLGFHSTCTKNKSIYIVTTDTLAFLEYIGPCPSDLERPYGHKWRYQDTRKSIMEMS
ncbi:MAG: helix-turn-helix domain-containing protein [Deltaproteobacteria bacterium]|nr:helix-turn-helix domain-containing protein [Deltaproteobacteria bacterium]